MVVTLSYTLDASLLRIPQFDGKMDTELWGRNGHGEKSCPGVSVCISGLKRKEDEKAPSSSRSHSAVAEIALFAKAGTRSPSASLPL